MGSYGIEITQGRHTPIAAGTQRDEHLLNGQLGLGVGMNRSGGSGFGEGEDVGFPVHGAGAAENDRSASVSVHGC